MSERDIRYIHLLCRIVDELFMYTSVPSLFSFNTSLGSLEQEILQILLNGEDVTVREVVTVIQQKRTIAYTTVMTVLEHLVDKGYLIRNKTEKAYRYAPVGEKESYIRQSIRTSFGTMIRKYGMKTLLLSFIPTPSFYGSPVYKYQKSTMLGFSFIAVGGLFVVSIWNLLTQIHRSGLVDYFSLFLTEPKLIQSDVQLFSTAIMENIPFTQSIILSVLLISIVGIIRRLMQLFNKTQLPWSGYGAAL